LKENNPTYPTLDNELERLTRLYHYNILGTRGEEQFDNLTQLTSQILNLPICQITLMDKNWQDFVSNVGVDMEGNHREMSFCQYTVVQNKILEIKDTQKDPRFKNHPLVTGEPYLRYYVGAPLIDKDGLVMGTLCGYGMEVNELSESQKEMLQNIAQTVMKLISYRKDKKDLSRYQNIFDLNQGLLCVISKEGYFQLVNPALKKALGWKEFELFAYPVTKFVFKPDRKGVHLAFQMMKYGVKNDGFSCRMRTKDGKVIWVDWSYFSDKNSSVLVASGHDMTGLIETQESLKEAVKSLNKASLIKDRFLSNMSHEIRTPLSTIIGYTDLLLEKSLPPVENSYLSNISTATNHLYNIVNDVLDIHKLEEGKVKLVHTEVNLNALAERVINMFKLSAHNKGISLKANLESTLPQTVKLDETRLTQVLSNLIGNAIKFTTEGGVRLNISASSLNSDLIQFKVTDTGIGIEKDKLSTIFERFSQAEDSTSRMYGGTGLGLSISKYLVKLFGGEISIASAPGEGTKIWFSLPAESVVDKPKVIERKKIKTLEGIKILLAEDNENLQLLCRIHVQKLSGQIQVASNGSEAISILKEEDFDIIIMDVQMPGMDGLAATEFIRQKLKLKTPIIGFTANADPSEVVRCKEAGMDDFLPKPFEIPEFVEKIQRFIQKDNFLAHLKVVADKEGQELVNEFIKIFKSRIPEDISALNQFVEEKNTEGLKSKAHFLTSTMRSMNFKKGEDLAVQICNQVSKEHAEKAFHSARLFSKYLHHALSQLSE